MQTEHTKIPWHAGHFGEGEYRRQVVFDAQSGQVCEVLEPADAAYIVRACNAHAGLVALLERVSMFFKGGEHYGHLYDAVRAAVDQAKKGVPA